MDVTGPEARRLRTRNGWSLQEFANRTRVNKAYLSEFETGKRQLPPEVRARLAEELVAEPAGHARPRIVNDHGHSRLVFVDEAGHEMLRPRIAHLTWVEEGGTSYTMYLGER